MKIRDLITHLEEIERFVPDGVIKAFNGDSGGLEPITGFLYGGNDNLVELCTDDNS